MARKKATPKPPKEKKERPDVMFAAMVAEKVCPSPVEDGVEDVYGGKNGPRAQTFKAALKHLSMLCGNMAKAGNGVGNKVYPYEFVYFAWCALYEKYLREQDTGAWKNVPTLLAVATSTYGRKPWIEQWPDEVMEKLPPVYMQYDHDSYVEDNAYILRYLGFRYGATDCPNRLTSAKVQELGL